MEIQFHEHVWLLLEQAGNVLVEKLEDLYYSDFLLEASIFLVLAVVTYLMCRFDRYFYFIKLAMIMLLIIFGIAMYVLLSRTRIDFIETQITFEQYCEGKNPIGEMTKKCPEYRKDLEMGLTALFLERVVMNVSSFLGFFTQWFLLGVIGIVCSVVGWVYMRITTNRHNNEAFTNNISVSLRHNKSILEPLKRMFSIQGPPVPPQKDMKIRHRLPSTYSGKK